MTQKRNYIIPEVAVLNCCTRECLMWANISIGPNPGPKRQDKPF
jgi:hypothetical protein